MNETFEQIVTRVQKSDTRKLLRLYDILKSDLDYYEHKPVGSDGVTRQDWISMKINLTQIKIELKLRKKLKC
jgi:hypothetical protein